jgi:hypothetical protein
MRAGAQAEWCECRQQQTKNVVPAQAGTHAGFAFAGR